MVAPARAQLVTPLEAHPTAHVLPPSQWLKPEIFPTFAQGEAPLDPAAMKLKDRWGASFQTETEVGESSSFSELSTFVPFSQVAGQSTYYFEGQLRLFSHDFALGGNARMGHRWLDPDTDLVWGGYLGWDVQRTEFRNTFLQLGLGAEVLAENWEGRFNAYLPVGDARQEAVDLRAAKFQGYRLLINRTAEVQMAGFDLEGGYRLLDWDDGHLYGYLSPYLLSANGAGTFLGMRGRLFSEFGDRYSAGLAVSSDGNFGTNVIAQVGVLLGRGRDRTAAESPTESVRTRLAQPVHRQDAIAIDRQETGFQVAINPATGAAWYFVHVTDGAANGDGTFENPFDNVVTDAVGLVPQDGNGIIYVDSGDCSGMDGFVLPTNVQALSTGVTQFIDVETGASSGLKNPFNIQLPGSGTGILPLIQSTVTMGNNSKLSGFDLQPTGDYNPGVFAYNVSNFTIDRNRITTTAYAADGIFAVADGGTVSNATISGNSISTSGNDANGIFAYAYTGGTISNTVISGNTIATAGDYANGVFTYAYTGGTISNTTISGSSITTTGNYSDGAFIYAIPGGTISNTTISGNTISTTGNDSNGIFVYAVPNTTISNTTISGNSIATSGSGDAANDIFIYAVAGGSISNVTLLGNTLVATGDDAIQVESEGNGSNISNVTISSNSISAVDDGIQIEADDNSTINNVTISSNTISTSGFEAQGIEFRLDNNGTINNAIVINNLIQQAGQHSIFVDTQSNDNTLCIAQFTENISSMQNVFGGGGNDLNFRIITGSTVRFVGFADLGVNNTGFDDISGSPTSQPSSCP